MLKRLSTQINATNVVVWGIGLSILVFVVWGSIATLSSGIYTTSVWIDFFIFGLAQGSVYALIALGYTLVYGVLFMINFAHGEVFMSGMYIAFFVARALDANGFLNRSLGHTLVSLLIITLVSMGVSTLIAVVLERIAYRPLRKAPRLVPLITAIGASFFLQHAFRGLFGPRTKVYPDVDILKGTWVLFGIDILKTQVIVIIASVIMMAGLWILVKYTKIGRAMRAVAEDKEVAALMGIDVDRVIVLTFAVGAALAGAAGILYALLFKQVTHTVGFIPGIKAFTAAVLGGIGNIPGAMLGGLFLGIFESLGPNLFFSGLDIPAPNQLKDVIAFVMLVLVLIFRPTGIVGAAIDEKKA